MTDIEGIAGRLSLDASAWKAGADQARASYTQAVNEIKGKSDELASSVQTDFGAMAAAQKAYQEESDRDLKATIAAMDQSKRSAGEWADAFRSTGTPVKELQSELRDLQAQLVGLRSAQAEAGAGSREYAAQIKATQLEIQQVSQQLRVARAAEQEFTAGVASGRQAILEFNAVASLLGGYTPGLSQGLMAVNSGLGGVAAGAIAATAALAALAIGVAASVKAYGDYQQALLKVQELTDGGRQHIEEYDVAIQGLAQRVPVSAKELAEGMFFLASGGIKGKEAIDALTMSAEASATGMGKTADIARVVGATINAYGAENITAAQATDILTATVIEAHIAPDKLAESLGKVLPIAAQAGVSFAQVGANIAVLTRNGVPADVAITGLRTALLALEAPGTEAKKALADIGISADDLRKMVSENLVGALQLLIERTGGNVDQIKTLIPEARALVDVLGTAGRQGETYAQVLDRIQNSTGKTDETFQASVKGWNAQLEILHNRFTALEIDVGSKIVPKLLEFGDDVNNIAKAVGLLSSAIGTWVHDATAGLTGLLDGIKQKWDALPAPVQAMISGGAFAGPLGQGFAGAGASFDQMVAPAAGTPGEHGQYGMPGPPPTPAAPPAPTFTQSPIPNYEDIRAGQAALAALTSEGRSLVGTMTDLQKLKAQDSVSSDVMKDKLTSLAAAEAKQEEAWAKAFDPAEAGSRIGRLKDLTDTYTQAVVGGSADEQAAAQQAIAVYLQETAAADTAAAEQKKLATEQRAAVAETERIRKQQIQLANEWANAVASATEKVGNAEAAARQKVQDASDKLDEAIARAGATRAQKEENDANQQVLAEGVQARKDELDEDLRNLHDHNADMLEEMRAGHQQQLQALRDAASERTDQLHAQRAERDEETRNDRAARDEATRNDRAARDAATTNDRAGRDATLSGQRAQQDALSAHNLKLEEIRKKGGPGMDAALTAENASYQLEEKHLTLAQTRATADRTQKQKDAADDLARKEKDASDDRARKQKDADDDRVRKAADAAADRATKEADTKAVHDLTAALALQLKDKTLEYHNQEHALQTGNAQALKDFKKGLEEELHLDKETLYAREEADQIAAAQRVYDASVRQAAEAAAKSREAVDQELNRVGTRIAQQGGTNPAGTIAPFATMTAAQYMEMLNAPTGAPGASQGAEGASSAAGGSSMSAQVTNNITGGLFFATPQDLAEYLAATNAQEVLNALGNGGR